MNIIVDANIVFSGIINSNGKIGDLLMNSKAYFNFIAPEFLRYEIISKYQRLIKISGLTLEQIKVAEHRLCKEIIFVSEEQIIKDFWFEAYELVSGIDEDDIHYVAYSKQFNCQIWSGDKKLTEGLLRKGFTSIINTNDLFELRKSITP